MIKLVFVQSEGAPEVALPPNGATFGRAPDNDLPIIEPSVSSHHGEIRIESGVWHVRDLGSTNGTWVNGKRVAATTTAPLVNGDMLSIGNVATRIYVGPAPMALASAGKGGHLPAYVAIADAKSEPAPAPAPAPRPVPPGFPAFLCGGAPIGGRKEHKELGRLKQQ